MTTRAMKREAAVWREIGRAIESFPDQRMFSHPARYKGVGMRGLPIGQIRAENHLAITPDGFAIDCGVCRALACYWMALECENGEAP